MDLGSTSFASRSVKKGIFSVNVRARKAVLILHAVGVVVVVVAQGAREGADVLARERIDGDASNIS